MIDKLISSDFSVLAHENGRIPPLDAVMPKPVVATPRTPFVWGPWLLRGLAVGVTALVYESNYTFEQYPQSLPIIAVAIISLLGLITVPARPSFHRELGAIFGAAAIAIATIAMLYLSWTAAPVLEFDHDAVSMRVPYVHDQLWSVGLVCACAVAVGYGLARCIRPRPRTLQPWAGLATVMTTALFFFAVEAQSFFPRWFDAVPFSVGHRTVEQLAYSATNHSVFDYIADWQIDALEATAVVTALVATIAVAYRSRSKIAARWLSIVSHVVVAPLCVAVAMWQTISVSAHDWYGGEDNRAFAIATVAVLVALTSMMVRRRVKLGG
jgi:hypothetical protein